MNGQTTIMISRASMNQNELDVIRIAESSTRSKYTRRQFKSMFGISSHVAAIVWKEMQKDNNVVGRNIGLKDFLMMLHFLKTYSTETVLCNAFGCTEKTFRGKYKKALSIVAHLPVICWERRHVHGNENDIAKVSIDGTDCEINEPSPWDSKWYSHKFHGAGLRYEIGVCIVTGHIVWVGGGDPAGTPDITIAREGILNLLDDDETLIADGGYKGEEKIWCKGHCKFLSRMESVVRARHETVNTRLKFFAVLKQKFRHDLHLHPMCFHAVANLVQLDIAHESPLFQIEYSE